MLDFQKQLQSLEFDSKIEGKKLIAWLGALSIEIRFTTQGNTVITRYGARIQNGHEEKLDLDATYDYVSTKISNYLREKKDDEVKPDGE